MGEAQDCGTVSRARETTTPGPGSRDIVSQKCGGQRHHKYVFSGKVPHVPRLIQVFDHDGALEAVATIVANHVLVASDILDAKCPGSPT